MEHHATQDQRKTKNEAHAFCLDNIFSSWVSVRVTSQYHEKMMNMSDIECVQLPAPPAR